MLERLPPPLGGRIPVFPYGARDEVISEQPVVAAYPDFVAVLEKIVGLVAVSEKQPWKCRGFDEPFPFHKSYPVYVSFERSPYRTVLIQISEFEPQTPGFASAVQGIEPFDAAVSSECHSVQAAVRGIPEIVLVVGGYEVAVSSVGRLGNLVREFHEGEIFLTQYINAGCLGYPDSSELVFAAFGHIIALEMRGRLSGVETQNLTSVISGDASAKETYPYESKVVSE